MAQRKTLALPGALARRQIRKPQWRFEADDDLWTLDLVSGLIEVSIWDGRRRPILWPWFDGFRCQISGEKSVDLEFPGVTSADEAKRLAVQEVMNVLHQAGSELGFWAKKTDVKVTEPIVLLSTRAHGKRGSGKGRS
ncbi:MAG TPA: hypothetical protein VMT99_01215 [Candidatus Paceibacterota bacterium]|nr:hypothetical protein [Candidatus Paceibacterota bacterium]